MSQEAEAPRTREEWLRSRLDIYERLIRLDRPIGILLLLWPTLSALWLAVWGKPPVHLVVIFVMGTVLMRWLHTRGGALDFRDHAKRSPGTPFPIAVALGADPATILGAVTPVPDTLSEYQFAGLLRGARTEIVRCLSHASRRNFRGLAVERVRGRCCRAAGWRPPSYRRPWHSGRRRT